MARAKPIGVQVFSNFPGLDAIAKLAKQRAITLKAVKAGAKIVQRAAKANAPRRSGALKQSIGIKAAKGTRGKTLAFVVIGARAKVEKVFRGRKVKPSKYSHLVEKGHKGVAARPFLKPALDSSRGAAERAMLDAMAEEISKALAKEANAAFKKFKG